jgi:Mrp family chromosome partitioning ATPase
MERISKALDLARAQRDARMEPVVSASYLDDPAPTPAQQPEFTDTLMFKSPLLSPDLAHLERERVLGPGATGEHAGAYKMLRTQVLRRMDQIHANALAILSPTAGAGKTLTAINLAIAIAAEVGRTALLVDMDLRNPSIHRRLGVTPQRGVEECLESNSPVQEAMFKLAGYDRLTVLPAKSRVRDSSELLASKSTAAVMQEMRSRYANRIIIIDLPPVLQADDALAFSRLVSAGLLVVGEGLSGRDDVKRSIEILSDMTIVGTVLNGSRDVTDGYY